MTEWTPDEAKRRAANVIRRAEARIPLQFESELDRDLFMMLIAAELCDVRTEAVQRAIETTFDRAISIVDAQLRP